MHLFIQNLQYSFRMLLKSPSFALVAIVTLALGIAANATIFSFINGLLLRPIDGVERPERLVSVYTSDYSSGQYGGSSYPDYVDLKQQADAFSDLAAYTGGELTLSSGSESAERLKVEEVTGNYFQLLGVDAQLGRTLRSEDDAPGAPATVVLSSSFWKRHYAQNSLVIGQSITLNSRPHTIVGVSSDNFKGLRLGSVPDLWVRMEESDRRGFRGIGITGRLRNGISLEQAQAQVTAIADRLAHAYPATNMGTLAQPKAPRPMTVASEERIGPAGKGNVIGLSALLLIVVGLVLLIACANVANLLLARSSVRRREIAIRLALGASRWRLIQQLLTESLLLALVGGAVGLIVTFWTAGLIPKLFPIGQASNLDLSVDWRVLIFTLAVSVATGVIFGLAPALQSSRLALVSTLKEEPNATSQRVARFGLRNLLVTAQVALSLLLLVSAALFLRSLHNAVTFDAGFDTRNLLIASLTTSGQSITTPQTATFYEELVNNLRSEPGVRSVSLSMVEPMSGGGTRNLVTIDGYEPRPNEDLELNTNTVGLDYFQTLGIPLVKGRDFTPGDREGSPGVVIVNEELAQRYFRDQNPLGKRLRLGSKGEFLEIIGVVRTAKYRNLRESPLPFFYRPLAQHMQEDMTLVVRTSGDPAALRPNVRGVMQRINRNIPFHSVKTISEQIESGLSPDRILASLLAVFGTSALLLAAVGIYGVVSFAVAQRTHEIGIRMALGARSTDVMKLVVRDGMLMVMVGVVLGLAGAFALTRLVDSLLFGITPTDLPTFGLVTLGLVLIAFIACYIPARRATKVDPLVALRNE